MKIFDSESNTLDRKIVFIKTFLIDYLFNVVYLKFNKKYKYLKSNVLVQYFPSFEGISAQVQSKCYFKLILEV